MTFILNLNLQKWKMIVDSQMRHSTMMKLISLKAHMKLVKLTSKRQLRLRSHLLI
jgi:hypothetical protein